MGYRCISSSVKTTRKLQKPGMYYYGYRYYDPVTGRWPSRDPIGEVGGPTWFERHATYLRKLEETQEDFDSIVDYFDLTTEGHSYFNAVLDNYRNQLHQELYFDDGSLDEMGNLYAFVKNSPANYFDIFGLQGDRGGKPKRNLSCEGFNLKSDPKDVEKALEAAKAAKQTKRAKALRALLKVIKRGGRLGTGMGGAFWWFIEQQWMLQNGCCPRYGNGGYA